MLGVALILVSLLLGVALRHGGRWSAEAPRALNTFVIYLMLPALVLHQITPMVAAAALDRRVLAPVSMPWLSFALAAVTLAWLGARRGWARATTGALILTVGLGNTAFVGYPLVEWLLGAGALPLAVIADQLGSFLVLSTLAVAVGARFGGGDVAWSRKLGQLLRFPPLVALAVAVAWGALGARHFATLAPLLERLAAPLVPTAMAAAGATLSLDRAVLRRRWPLLALGLGAKMLLLPLVCLALYLALGVRGLALHVTVLQAAMAPMVTGAVLAAELGLDAELAALMVGIGAPLSLVTVPAWARALDALWPR